MLCVVNLMMKHSNEWKSEPKDTSQIATNIQTKMNKERNYQLQ